MDVMLTSMILLLFEDHLQSIRNLFNRLSVTNFTINLSKSEVCHAVVTFLSHEVGQGNVMPIEAKVKAISEFPIPDGNHAFSWNGWLLQKVL